MISMPVGVFFKVSPDMLAMNAYLLLGDPFTNRDYDMDMQLHPFFYVEYDYLSMP